MTLLAIPDNTVRIYELYRSKVSGGILSVAHSGVGFEDVFGNIVVLHRTPDNNTHLSTEEDFSANQKVTVKGEFPADSSTLKRAQHILDHGQAYSALTNNCEHLVDFVLGREVKSEQVRNTVMAVLGTYSLGHLLKLPTKNKVIVAGVAGLFTLLMTKRKKLKRS